MLRLGVPRHAPTAFIIVSALSLILVAGCSGSTSSGDSRAGDNPTASAAASTPARQWVEDLIAGRDVSFSVVFPSENMYFYNLPEYLFWRQGNGVVRWDVVPSGSAQPGTGWFSIKSDTPASDTLPYRSMECLWLRWGSPGADGMPQAQIWCGEGGSAPTLLDSAMLDRIAERLPDQTIAGREASCYSFDDPMMAVAVFCVDASKGIPLLLSTVWIGDPSIRQELQALSVSTAELELEFPVRLERSPVDGWWEFGGIVPLSSLQLPDFSQFED
jgi:hypothetical protein